MLRQNVRWSDQMCCLNLMEWVTTSLDRHMPDHHIFCLFLFSTDCFPFKHQPHKMVKHTQTIRVLPFCGVAFKGLNSLMSFFLLPGTLLTPTSCFFFFKTQKD